MKSGGPSARILVALGFFLCASGIFAAPVTIGFIAPDEEPRYTNLVSGLRQGLQAAGVSAESAIIVEHRIRRGDSAGALRAAGSLSAGSARVAFVVGTELTKLVRSVAKDLPMVVRVLNGQSAGDMPIEQPTKFEFVINLRSAKALGIMIPQALLLRADEVIQ